MSEDPVHNLFVAVRIVVESRSEHPFRVALHAFALLLRMFFEVVCNQCWFYQLPQLTVASPHQGPGEHTVIVMGRGPTCLWWNLAGELHHVCADARKDAKTLCGLLIIQNGPAAVHKLSQGATRWPWPLPLLLRTRTAGLLPRTRTVAPLLILLAKSAGGCSGSSCVPFMCWLFVVGGGMRTSKVPWRLRMIIAGGRWSSNVVWSLC